MFKSINVNYSEQEDIASGNAWARLEQEYQPDSDDKAKLSDLSQMLGLARVGESAYNHITDTCIYAKVEGTSIIVTLDFYVWVSSLDLPYTLKADTGIISTAEIVEEHRSFDVALKGSAASDLPYIFEGELTPEMPFISSSGNILENVEVTVTDSRVLLSESAYCVLRAEGVATGYKHSIEMVLVKELEEGEIGDHTNSSFTTSNWAFGGGSYDKAKYPVIHHDGAIVQEWVLEFTNTTNFILKNENGSSVGYGDINTDFVTQYFTLRAAGWRSTTSLTSDSYLNFRVIASDGIDHTGYKISNLQNTITIAYVDEENKTHDSEMTLKIPPCVEDLLKECPGDGTTVIWISCLGKKCDDTDPYYVVRVNGCNGHIVSQGWESNA